jgi:hypothetical protein
MTGLVGLVLMCTFNLEFYRAYPEELTYIGIAEGPCTVVDSRGPNDIGDKRISLTVNCTEMFSTFRLTKSNVNEPIRHAIYQEDCF